MNEDARQPAGTSSRLFWPPSLKNHVACWDSAKTSFTRLRSFSFSTRSFQLEEKIFRGSMESGAIGMRSASWKKITRAVLSTCSSMHPSIYLSDCLSICLSIYLHFYLYTSADAHTHTCLQYRESNAYRQALQQWQHCVLQLLQELKTVSNGGPCRTNLCLVLEVCNSYSPTRVARGPVFPTGTRISS